MRENLKQESVKNMRENVEWHSQLPLRSVGPVTCVGTLTAVSARAWVSLSALSPVFVFQEGCLSRSSLRERAHKAEILLEGDGDWSHGSGQEWVRRPLQDCRAWGEEAGGRGCQLRDAGPNALLVHDLAACCPCGGQTQGPLRSLILMRGHDLRGSEETEGERAASGLGHLPAPFSGRMVQHGHVTVQAGRIVRETVRR